MAVNLPHCSRVPVKPEQALGKSTHPVPLVTHKGKLAPADLGKKVSQSESEVAVIL